MPLVATWKNQLVEKVQEQGGVFRDSVTTRSTFAAFKTHFGYTFIILTSGNISMRLGSVYQSALLTSTFSEISRLLMHRIDFQCGLWPIIQFVGPGRPYWIYRDCQRDIEQVLYFMTVIIVTVSIYTYTLAQLALCGGGIYKTIM